MPNWTEQQLHVVGTKADIDKFLRVGYTRANKSESDSLLHFDVLCPPERYTQRRDEDITSGVALMHWRTSNQACFELITAWDYPAYFYALMPTEWPTLSWCCTVSGEMGDFGGLVMCVDGEFIDLIRDFQGGYDRRAHLRAARSALRRWMAFLTRGRDWRVMPDKAWELGAMRADAHCDGDFWFYFPTREAMNVFRSRYRCHHPERRMEQVWKRTR